MKILINLNKILSFLLLIVVCSFSQGQVNQKKIVPNKLKVKKNEKAIMDYQFTWDVKSSVIHVKLNYTPAISDSTVFTYGDGKPFNIFGMIKNIKVSKEDLIKIDNEKNEIIIYHNSKGNKTIQYDINDNVEKYTKIDERFRPIIKKEFLYTIGKYLMLLPANQNTIQHSVSVQWMKLPKDMSHFFSYGTSNDPLKKIYLEGDDLKNSIVIITNEHFIEKHFIKDIPYYYIYPKNETMNNFPKEYEEVYGNYFLKLRDFWNDYNDPYYFMFLLPTTIESGGIAIKNGFIMKYENNKIIPYTDKLVFFHEAIHHWLGSKIIVNDSKEEMINHQWFQEGFTEYVDCFVSVASNVMNYEQFLSFLNDENLKSYYDNPFRELNNKEVSASFWEDTKHSEIPYKRGFIYAFYLDNQIRLASNGKFTLRDFLLDLFKTQQELDLLNSGTGLTDVNFSAILEKYLDKNTISRTFDDYIIKGIPIDFNKVKLIPEFELYFENNIPQIKLSKEVTDLNKIFKW